MQIITIDAYFKDFVTGLDRRQVYASQWLPEYLDNANQLLTAVNNLFTDLSVKAMPLTSGWRPATLNAATPNAAKASLHMICKAGDFDDNANQDLAKLVASRPDLLRKYNLFMEDPQYTKGATCWVHLDCGVRADRPSRLFIP